MCGTIPEVRIAKCDMLCPHRNLFANIGQHYRHRHRKKTSMIDWCNWTMLACMLAAPRRFRVTNHTLLVSPCQTCIAFKRGQLLTNWLEKWGSFDPGGAALFFGGDTCNNWLLSLLKTLHKLKQGDFILAANDCIAAFL